MTDLVIQILRFESLPSTNLEAARRATEGAPEGLSVVAGEQTAGRGRRERQWVSPPGAGLYFSLLLRPTLDQSDWPLITLMSAVAVQETLAAACGLQADIKWPNDLLFDERKLCGILAETVETSLGRAVVVGIGVNLMSGSFPPELDPVAISVEAGAAQKPDLELVLEELVQRLADGYLRLQQPGGTVGIQREWCARSSYCRGKAVRVTEGTTSFEGTTRGLEPGGALRVETDDGEIRIVRAGDVSSVRSTPG
jgi:BirA family biotin operon repressor/biotin-[acetyl-CoA-carboxylase] ligase